LLLLIANKAFELKKNQVIRHNEAKLKAKQEQIKEMKLKLEREAECISRNIEVKHLQKQLRREQITKEKNEQLLLQHKKE